MATLVRNIFLFPLATIKKYRNFIKVLEGYKLQLANGLLYCLRQYFILDSLNKPAEKNKQWVSIL